jgi:hypothetical protein
MSMLEDERFSRIVGIDNIVDKLVCGAWQKFEERTSMSELIILEA